MEYNEAMAQQNLQGQVPEEDALCPDIYVVQPGDTYYGIAGKLGITVYELSGMNPYIDPDNLRIGEHLCIPLQTEDIATSATPTLADAQFQIEAQAQVEALSETRQQAPLIPPAPLIATPEASPRAPDILPYPPIAAPTPPIATMPTTQTCPVNHMRITVPPGWTCCDVQRRYNVSYDALAKANPNVNIDSLRNGQPLCVPPTGSRGLCGEPGMFTYIVEKSDSLDSISRRYRVSAGNILKGNPNLAPGDFIVGRVVCIPG